MTNKSMTRRTVIATGATLAASAIVPAIAAERIGPDEFDQDAITTLLVTTATDTGASLDALYWMTKGLPLTAMRMVCNNVGKMPAPFKYCLHRPQRTPSMPATMSPAMCAAIEAHKVAFAEFHESNKAEPWLGDATAAKKARWEKANTDDDEAFMFLCELKPAYPGDLAAKAAYLNQPKKWDIGDDHIVAILQSMEGA